ncbi:MAG: hypothetical protein AAF841_10470, partial [Pseudomonadota bacterium]
MSFLRKGPVAAALLGAGWMITLSITVAVAVAFVTGEALRPSMLWSLLLGAALGAGFLVVRLSLALAAGGSLVIGEARPKQDHGHDLRAQARGRIRENGPDPHRHESCP